MFTNAKGKTYAFAEDRVYSATTSTILGEFEFPSGFPRTDGQSRLWFIVDPPFKKDPLYGDPYDHAQVFYAVFASPDP